MPSSAERSYTAREWRLAALSPLDGRYGAQLEPYAARFSEAALIKERFFVEVEWLLYLSKVGGLQGFATLSGEEAGVLRRWAAEFGLKEAGEVKDIEAVTKHDVKAVEYYLKGRLARELGWAPERAEAVHFGATSEDVNNLAYARMARSALQEAWLPAAEGLVEEVREMALGFASQPMLARTHGQPATPTTFGKELAVFVVRWERQLGQVKAVEIPGKWGGATGTLAAAAIAFPEVDWATVAKEFVSSLGFVWSSLTTQVEPHDWMAELFGAMGRFGTVLLDFCRDMWSYVSLGYLRQKVVEGEVGSSAMPHKVNPVDFENAEANVGMAAALLDHLSAKLPVSRLQRDLSDSSTLRNIGCAFGYSALAIASARRGLGRVAPDEEALLFDLDQAWEVLAEAVQTVMRRYGIAGGYEKLRDFSRGRVLSAEELHHFVRGLELPPVARRRLLALTPATYTGLAGELAKLVEKPGSSASAGSIGKNRKIGPGHVAGRRHGGAPRER
jgi:adenylosuccinate lyase